MRDTLQRIWHVKRRFAIHYKIIERLGLKPVKEGNFTDLLTTLEYQLPVKLEEKVVRSYLLPPKYIVPNTTQLDELLRRRIAKKEDSGYYNEFRLNAKLNITRINHDTCPKYEFRNGILNISLDKDWHLEQKVTRWLSMNPQHLVLRFECLEGTTYKVYTYHKGAIFQGYLYDFGSHVSIGKTLKGAVSGAKKRVINHTASLME